MAGWGWPLAKWTNTATTAPGTGDDIDDDWQVTSLWVDATNGNAYICVDNTRGAAVWVQVGSSTAPSYMSAGTMWNYKANTGATSGYPGDGYLLWNNATQTSATNLLFAHVTFDGLDLDVLLGYLANGNTLIVQDADVSTNFQKWTINGVPTNTNGGTSTSYWTVPVTLVSSGGTGTTGFANNHRLIVFVIRNVLSTGGHWTVIGGL